MAYYWSTWFVEPLTQGRKLRIALLTLVTYLSLC